MKKNILQIVSALLLSFSISMAWAKNDVPASKLINIVFANLEEPLLPDWNGCTIDEKSKSCKVRDFLMAALTDLAEQGFNNNRPKYLKGKKPKNGGATQDGQPSWSRSECELSKATSDFIDWIKESNIYHATFSEALKKYKDKNVFACKVSWGVDFGEIKWHKELRFFLDSDQKLIPGSFAVNWTP